MRKFAITTLTMVVRDCRWRLVWLMGNWSDGLANNGLRHFSHAFAVSILFIGIQRKHRIIAPYSFWRW